MTTRKIVWAVTVALLFLYCGFEIYHSNGFVHATKKPGSLYNGCICHGDSASTSVTVTISGPESLGIGQVGSYVLRVVRDTNIAAGFNVAAFLGDLMAGDSLEQQLMEGELTHTLPKFSVASDTISWMFLYQAPEVSVFDTLYAVANSVDTSYEPTGDYWNFSQNFVVRIGNATNVTIHPLALPAHHRLLQNYPNPFNPSTVIHYRLPVDDFVTLNVYNIVGSEVGLLVQGYKAAGDYDVGFDARNLPSGIYFYRLSARNFTETRKMVLIR